MNYVGSKNRLSKELAPIIQQYVDKGCSGYLEPFVGGAGMIDKINCKVNSDNIFDVCRISFSVHNR